MHIVKQGGVKELARQTGSIQEPAVCLIDGLRASNRMQLGQMCPPTYTCQVARCYLLRSMYMLRLSSSDETKGVNANIIDCHQ